MKSLRIAVAAALFLILPAAIAQASNYGDSKSVKSLKSLLLAKPELEAALKKAIADAGMDGITDIPQFETYINGIVRLVPTNRNIDDKLGPLYIITDISDTLRTSPEFENWSKEVVSEWGHFLDSPLSIGGLSTFYDDPSMNMEDYYVGPSGWLTFNQFFAREIKPGKRPIAGLGDGRTIVSPGDSVYKGSTPITDDATTEVKGVTHRISDLLKDTEYAERFAGGQFIHFYLSITDYHRFHVPFAGKVVEKKILPGFAYIGVFEKPDGSTYLTDGAGYQFRQERGLIVLETEEIGYVAILPIGMGPVSSVELTPDVGAELHKGEEFGFFQFGGSDVVVLFEKDAVDITAEPGKHYLQGAAIGTAKPKSK
ncbi:phosphatidylserine decarboxylase [Microbaculum marinum]|uniref:Phosphatidylserine decarboxylase n=1 Tax=Microbaculum marinum TaxID=1764581 RepID=A0AAW9RXC6_9HYPH